MPDDRLTLTELLILMAIQGLQHDGKEPYGVSIYESLSYDANQDTPLTTIYDCLGTLSGKRCVTEGRGAPSAKRGGKAKRLYSITDRGICLVLANLRSIDEMRQRFEKPESPVSVKV